MAQRILIVCTGNICRSPLAEAILRHKMTQAGREKDFLVDSAGTHDYHVGERPDPRTVKIANLNGVSTEGIRARQVTKADFEAFDLILGMDKGHMKTLQKIAPTEYQHKIYLFMDFMGGGDMDVPDPYYGVFEGFEQIYKIINDAFGKYDLTLCKILCKL